MPAILYVMLGGAMGAGGRHLVGRTAFALFGPGLPVGTLFVNVSGGLLMGVLAGVLARHSVGEAWRLFLGIGVLGGFTTFSSFSLEMVTLIERGAIATAAGYALMSVVGAVAALFGGLYLVRALA